jgi:hypothetical protein
MAACSSFYDVDWANQQLRYGIRILRREGCAQSIGRAISDAIIIRNRLADNGFWWQADRLDNFIHLYMKKAGSL